MKLESIVSLITCSLIGLAADVKQFSRASILAFQQTTCPFLHVPSLNDNVEIKNCFSENDKISNLPLYIKKVMILELCEMSVIIQTMLMCLLTSVQIDFETWDVISCWKSFFSLRYTSFKTLLKYTVLLLFKKQKCFTFMMHWRCKMYF